ncbi:hypothetical protein Glove_184g84 [Diversispora epigaea]|uniref:Uncharacterized protein n=1 Tax=Diversispora epigaea TaxID=1348612 RepID=A0A397IMP2_9GLOM|nr:hypothetical protein Glove_184g84 [Diversispora epigaea]
MTKSCKKSISLISPGVLVEKLHYGPYSQYWWLPLPNSSKEITTYFPIRVQQKIRAILNDCEFTVTIVVGNKDNDNSLPGYVCQCENIVETANDSTNAISRVYFKIFRSKTRYSGPLIMGWTDENIINKLNEDIPFIPHSFLLEKIKIFVYRVGYSTNIDWFNARPGYKSSILHKFDGNKQALFVSKIEETSCILEIYQDQILKTIIESKNPIDIWRNSTITINQTIANINWYQLFSKWDKQESPIIELHDELNKIYSEDYQFSIWEICAWQIFLHAAGANNVTPWSHKEQHQFWSKSNHPKQDHALLTQLYQMGFLVKNISTPDKNSTSTFWQYFNYALADNKKNYDRKCRILSIIANDFTYKELQENLEHVNMSSYKTDNTSELPVLYLQDHKKALWNQFHKQYPNRIQRTFFMTKLDGKCFVYKENLGGFCSECNECRYQHQEIL